jgi:hypothetical protein
VQQLPDEPCPFDINPWVSGREIRRTHMKNWGANSDSIIKCWLVGGKSERQIHNTFENKRETSRNWEMMVMWKKQHFDKNIVL